MYYGESKQGRYVIAVIMDDRFLCGYSIVGAGTKKENGVIKKAQELAIANANEKLARYSKSVEGELRKSNIVSSFFSNLKCEYLHRFKVESKEELEMILHRYETYYNYIRLHSSLGYSIPFVEWAEKSGVENADQIVEEKKKEIS